MARPTLTCEIDFSSAVIPASYESYIYRSIPYQYLRLKETSGTNADDASGNNRDGTYAGTYTLNQTASKPITGETASRYILLGGGGGGTVPGRISFTATAPAQDTITFEALIYQDAMGVSSDRHSIIHNTQSDLTFNVFRIDVGGDGKIYVRMGALTTTTNSAVVTAGSWHHIAVVVDANAVTVTIYVNGTAVPSTTVNTFSLITVFAMFSESSTDTWYWGLALSANVAGRFPVDRMAEPTIYHRALSAGELTAHQAGRSLPATPAPNWVDVSDYLSPLHEIVVKPGGRSMELERVSAGTLDLHLDNSDRRFEPEYASSPYYPNVKPRRKIRLKATWAGTDYWLFNGYIDDWPQESPSPFQNYVKVHAVDGFAILNGQKLDSSWNFTEQTAGGRVAAALLGAAWPTADVDLDAGKYSVQAEPGTLSGSLAEHLLMTAASDGGLAFLDGQGRFVFHDGNHRTTDARSTASQATFSDWDTPGQFMYAGFSWNAGGEFIFNNIVLKRKGGVEVRQIDFLSQSQYWNSDHSQEVNLSSDDDVRTRCLELLTRYKDPKTRFTSVTIDTVIGSHSGSSIWPIILNAQISDRYTMNRHPMGGTVITKACFLESMEHHITADSWVVVWGLSLA